MGIIGNIFVKLGLDNKDYKKGLEQSEKQTSSFGGVVGKIGGMIAAAFAIETVVRFGKEVSALAAKAEGVERAFMKIADQATLQGLRDSTQGMVSDLDLMRNAVKANNFRIPLEQLGTYFNFAAQRAAETGESVDYLVESIITGLGRQSVMILDNLGLSAAEIRDEMAKGGSMAEAVGTIIARSMKGATNAVSETAKQTANLTVEWDNFKVSLGTTLNKFITPILKGINDVIDNKRKLDEELAAGTANKTGWDRVKQFLNPFFSGAKQFAGNQMSDYNKNTQSVIDGIKDTASANEALRNITNSTWSDLDLNINKVRKTAEKFLKETKTQTVEQKDSIAALTAQLNEVTLARDNETDAIKRADLNGQISKLEELIKRKQEEGKVIASGLLPALQKEIEAKQELLNFEKDPTKIRTINDEIAAMNKRLDVLKMTSQEYANFNQYRTNPLKPITSTVGGQATSQQADPIKAAQEKAAQLKAANEGFVQSNKEALDQFGMSISDWENVGQQLNGVIQNSMINSFDALADALGGLKDVNVASVLAALLSPFADFAISLGTIILTSGHAIEGLKAALIGFFGGSAIVAGAALIAIGVGAKVGIAALAKSGSKSSSTSTGSSTSYSGGYSVAGASSEPIKVQVYGVLSGQDIVISSEKTTSNRNR